MERMIQHVRHPLDRSKYIGTVAAVYRNGRIGVSFAQCHPSDHFSRKVGRDKATGRAVSLTFEHGTPRNKYNEPLVPANIKGLRCRHPILVVMDQLRETAYKVWKPAFNIVQ